MRKIFPGIISVLLFLGAGWLCWIGTAEALSAHASKSWAAAEGRITYSEFEYSGTGSSRRRQPVVRYSYMVEGIDYASDRIAFGPVPSDKGGGAVLTTSRDDRIYAFATLKEGSPVTVYYDERMPSEAVLLRGGGTFVLIYYFCGLLAAGMAVLCFMLATGRIKG